jgi:hypothetical protein
MSKVKLVKIWLCIGVLFAFLSGGTVSWLLNQMLYPLAALPDTPGVSDTWVDRFIREMRLSDDQARELREIVEGWEESRIELQHEYQQRFKRVNNDFEDRIKGILTLDQLEAYEGGV